MYVSMYILYICMHVDTNNQCRRVAYIWGYIIMHACTCMQARRVEHQIETAGDIRNRFIEKGKQVKNQVKHRLLRTNN